MTKRQIIILKVTIIILIILLGIKLFSIWMIAVMEGKPDGPYYSSLTIDEAKKEQVWIATYLPESNKYYSYNKTDSFELAEIWIEKNKNDKEIYWSEADYELILNIHFKRLTEDELHKFRLIPLTPLKLNEYEKIEHPDGYPRVRFLLNEIKDTIKIEVIERNPNDSLAWITEKSIDTITLIKKN